MDGVQGQRDWRGGVFWTLFFWGCFGEIEKEYEGPGFTFEPEKCDKEMTQIVKGLFSRMVAVEFTGNMVK